MFPKTVHNTKTSDHIGHDSSVQRFYETGSSNGNVNWGLFAPPALADPKRIKIEGAALQLYHRNDLNQPPYSAQKHYVSRITMQSPFIRSNLEVTFATYGLKYDTDRAVHSFWPHKALYFAREKIAEVARTAESDLARDHCELLGTELENALADTLDAVEELRKTNEITFSLLWTLFPDNSIFATKWENSIKAFRVKQCFQGKEFQLKCETVSFNGFEYGMEAYDMKVDQFQGRISVGKIPDLPIYDLGREGMTRRYLVERGRRILDFQGIHYVSHIPSKENKTSEPDILGGSQPVDTAVRQVKMT